MTNTANPTSIAFDTYCPLCGRRKTQDCVRVYTTYPQDVYASGAYRSL